jgi:thioester reductase-like protein
VAEAFRRGIGVDAFSRHDDFFAIGGHSVVAAQIVGELRRGLGVETLAVRHLFEAPTVAGLAEVIDRLRRGDAVLPRGVRDLSPEAALAPELVPPGPLGHAVDRPDAVLLTGATGYLGAFLLAELVRRTEATVYCLVRAGSREQANQRVVANLKKCGLTVPGLASRVVALPGDLARPCLGLDEDTFARLAHVVDAIYHNGAEVNFAYPYESLAPANVEGTREVVRLACTGRTKAVHYVSTTAVLNSPAYASADSIPERENPEHGGNLSMGYAQSKWVAEKMVRTARERGLPVGIYRPGNIVGDRATGAGNPNDFIWRMVKGCIQLGCAPEIDMIVDVTPIDYVSQAIVALSLRPEQLGKNFHPVHPTPPRWNELMQLVDALGYPVELVPYPEWRRVLGEKGSTDDALVPLGHLFTDVPASDGPLRPRVLRYGCEEVQAGLAETTIRCAPVDRELVGACLRYFVGTGFLPEAGTRVTLDRRLP